MTFGPVSPGGRDHNAPLAETVYAVDLKPTAQCGLKVRVLHGALGCLGGMAYTVVSKTTFSGFESQRQHLSDWRKRQRTALVMRKGSGSIPLFGSIALMGRSRIPRCHWDARPIYDRSACFIRLVENRLLGKQ